LAAVLSLVLRGLVQRLIEIALSKQMSVGPPLYSDKMLTLREEIESGGQVDMNAEEKCDITMSRLETTYEP